MAKIPVLHKLTHMQNLGISKQCKVSGLSALKIWNVDSFSIFWQILNHDNQGKVGM